jgi:hypothetical protein
MSEQVQINIKSLFDDATLTQEARYEIGAEFLPANLAAASVADLLIQQKQGKEIGGEVELSATYLHVNPLDEGKIKPKMDGTEVDLIKFNANIRDENYELVVPANIFTKDTLKELDTENMPKMHVSEHINARNSEIEQRKAEGRDINTQLSGDKAAITELYDDTAKELISNPLITGEAVSHLKDKMLLNLEGNHGTKEVLEGQLSNPDAAKVFDEKYEAAIKAIESAFAGKSHAAKSTELAQQITQ